MADFLFDGTAKTITEPAGAGNTSYDVERDIYSAWKRWVTDDEGSKYLEAFSVEGGTPIGATGLFTGTTFILVNDWKIKAASHDHILTLTGNLFSDDNVLSVSTSGYSVLINVVSSIGAQGISTGSALTAAQDTKLTELYQVNALDSVNAVTLPKDEGDLTTGSITIDIVDNGSTRTLTRQ